MSHVLVTSMTKEHWPEVAKIYKQGVDTGFATFEKEIPSYEKWNKNHISRCRLVAIKEDMVLGWAALSHVSERCVYGGVAEVSIYMSLKNRGMGYGATLMNHLISCSEKNGFWTLQSGIFPTNIGSIKLHEKVGFRFLGVREKIGELNGIWHDNHIYERRSKIIGF